MSKHQRLTEAERERRRAQDRERLKQAAEQLLSSEGWQRWVRARASNGLARYSLTNQLLVALQSGGRATLVAGFKAWLALGYCVKRGGRAIRIMAKRALARRRWLPCEDSVAGRIGRRTPSPPAHTRRLRPAAGRDTP